MVNYQNGKIYKIINENNKIIYIGSTVQILCKRYMKHTHKAPNHKIILIENYSCNSREELCRREQEVIEEYSNLLNQRKSYITEEEKKEQKKKCTQEYKKKHYNNIKKYHKEYNKNYYKNIKIKCEFCNCEITKHNLKQHQKSQKCLNNR